MLSGVIFRCVLFVEEEVVLDVSQGLWDWTGPSAPDLALWPRADVRCVTETCVGSMYFWSLSKRRGKWELVRLCADSQPATAAVKRGSAQRLFALGIIFQSDGRRERLPSSKQAGNPWQPPAGGSALFVLQVHAANRPEPGHMETLLPAHCPLE